MSFHKTGKPRLKLAHWDYKQPKFSQFKEKMLNFIAEIPGAARFRSGFVKNRITRGGAVARLLDFQLNADTGYTLEFTNGFMRAYKDDELLKTNRTTTTAITITITLTTLDG